MLGNKKKKTFICFSNVGSPVVVLLLMYYVFRLHLFFINAWLLGVNGLGCLLFLWFGDNDYRKRSDQSYEVEFLFVFISFSPSLSAVRVLKSKNIQLTIKT